MNTKITRIKRQTRIRTKLANATDRLRLSVFRSNKYVYAQIIDKKGNTILGISEKSLPAKGKVSPIDRSRELGLAIAKLALSKKIQQVAFDKGRFSYHGRVEALAKGAREGGLKF